MTTSRRTAATGRSRKRPVRAAVTSRSSAGLSAHTRALTDHDEIMLWAEERRAQPAHVRGTGGGGDVGIIRLDFPGYSGAESLEPVEWEEWFRKFDGSNLALIIQDETAGGERSNFNKLVSRDTVGGGRKSRRTGRGERAA